MSRHRMLCMAWLVGCGSQVIEHPASVESSTNTSADVSTGGLGSASATTAASTSASATTLPATGSSELGGEGTGSDGSFVVPLDFHTTQFDCDPEGLDCPAGQKCSLYLTSDAQAPWDNTACFPLDTSPAQVGEPCEYLEGPWSGHDTCDSASVCWLNDGDSGYCKGLCRSEQTAPGARCLDPLARPSYAISDNLCMCETLCDPLVQDCRVGETCVLDGDDPICILDASETAGALADSCTAVNTCDPGLACVDSGNVGNCTQGDERCCTPFCDLDQPTCPANLTCMAVAATVKGLPQLGLCVDG